MMVRSITIALAVLALAGCGRKEAPEVLERPGQAPVVSVKPGDPEMEAAQKKARDTLDEFIAELTHKKPSQTFSVKGPFAAAGDEQEHIWIDELTYKDGVFQGKLANEPVGIPGKHLGSVVQLKREEVEDWLIMDGDNMRGGFTAEVLSHRMNEKQ